jgi:hypothetical protein
MVLIIVFAFAVNIAFRRSSSAPFNNSIYIMQQTDMNDVQYGDAVISSASKVSELQAGNVVLCLTSYDNEYKEVLKLIDVTQEDGTTYYYVKSDQDSVDDALKLTQDKVLAKCLWTNSSLGKVITFTKSTVGIAVLVALPCIVLLIMFIGSTVAQQKEAEKEEELRKSNAKKAKKRKSKPSEESKPAEPVEDAPKPKDEPKPSKKVDPDEFFSKPANKPIPVKTLSEEESARQRENASSMVGSELSSATIKLDSDFNSDSVKVSPMSHIDAVKIENEPATMDEDVHSPNMTEKANQIRQALSNDGVSNGTVDEPVVAVVPTATPSTPTTPVAKSEPAEPTPSEEVVATTTEPVQAEPSTPTKDAIDVDAPIIFNGTESAGTTATAPTTTTSTPTTPAATSTYTSSRVDDFDEDDFLEDIFGTASRETSKASKVSDDLLDQLLDSIPSSNRSTESVKKASATAAPKKVSTSTKSDRRTTKPVTKHHKATKVTDDTSFDELLKAIEKEKHGNK